jgi:hypothetical protein
MEQAAILETPPPQTHTQNKTNTNHKEKNTCEHTLCQQLLSYMLLDWSQQQKSLRYLATHIYYFPEIWVRSELNTNLQFSW